MSLIVICNQNSSLFCIPFPSKTVILHNYVKINSSINIICINLYFNFSSNFIKISSILKRLKAPTSLDALSYFPLDKSYKSVIRSNAPATAGVRKISTCQIREQDIKIWEGWGEWWSVRWLLYYLWMVKCLKKCLCSGQFVGGEYSGWLTWGRGEFRPNQWDIIIYIV